jgi:hypothetical protein
MAAPRCRRRRAPEAKPRHVQTIDERINHPDQRIRQDRSSIAAGSSPAWPRSPRTSRMKKGRIVVDAAFLI